MELQPIVDALVSSLRTLADKGIGPFVGALFGALSAFGLERHRVRGAQLRERVASLNRTQFVLSAIRDALKLLHDRYLEPMRNDPARWRKLSPLALAPNSLNIDIVPLIFLVDLARKDLLRDIHDCGDGHQAVLTALQERRMAHERLWAAVSEVRREHPELTTHEEIDHLVGPTVTGPLESLTDALYESVADVLPLITRTEAALAALATEIRKK